MVATVIDIGPVSRYPAVAFRKQFVVTNASRPIINEFMAANDHTLRDQDGDYSDETLIRNPLLYDFGRELGLESPRSCFFGGFPAYHRRRGARHAHGQFEHELLRRPEPDRIHQVLVLIPREPRDPQLLVF